MAIQATGGIAPEHQCVDWKEKWDDEFLKWICGFANGQGGRLEIGRNNDGLVVGLPNFKKLLDDLPNKIKSTMGILPAVNLCYEDGNEYIVIDVPAYPNAISYRGRYYQRSGSVNLELTGYALDELMLRTYGRTWDSAPIPRVKAEDFLHDAFKVFRQKAVQSGRLKQEDVAVSDTDLLKSLKLVEGDYLLKAAVLLFHQDPDEYCIGSYVKIGYFENAAEIRYQDEIAGPILTVPDRVMDTIYTKYFKGLIHYEGLQRVDRYPMPREALKEAVMNAIVHRSYETGSPIQIKIFDDKVYIFNDARMPPGITELDLEAAHKSMPYNPLIANAFFRSGQIEAWGRGIEKIKTACAEDGLPAPEFKITPSSFCVCFHIRNNNKILQETTAADIYGKDDAFARAFAGNETQKKIVALMLEQPEITAKVIAEQIGLTLRGVQKSIDELKKDGIVEHVGPTKSGRWEVRLPE